MKTNITTLEQLANYINSEDYNQLEVNRIIEENGWEDTSDKGDYYICANGNESLEFDSEAKAVVVER